MTTELELLSVRQLQKETARVLAAHDGFNNQELVKFNQLAHHDSCAWYRAVIQWYVDQYGDLPSRIGPGIDVRLLVENDDAHSNL